MSGAPACSCPERSKPLRARDWTVDVLHGNRSAFSGYRWTPSGYSQVRCHACGAVWRTRAAYANDLALGVFRT